MDDEIQPFEQIKNNYQAVQERIRHSAELSGRDPKDIKLVVVSKGKSIDTIAGAVSVGMNVFGENYADHALPKISALRQIPEIRWHMIGHVQSRKVPLVVDNFDYMHSLDSVKLATRLDRFAHINGKLFSSLIEFNLSGEERKTGFQAWSEENWEKLLPEIEKILQLDHIQIHGLMTIPPFSVNPENSRPYYQMLVRLQNFLSSNFPKAFWSELSMGMSGDFEVAVEEGATWIRVGQAILGPRN